MGRKLLADQPGVFPHRRERIFGRSDFSERRRVVARALAKRAGLPEPEARPRLYENLGNRELPVYAKKQEIQKTIRDNQISMLDGPTGSGKSTQLAQYAKEMGYRKVVYLEPRIILADNLADRLTSELSSQLGPGVGDELVGVRHSRLSTGRGKDIEIMTPATFLRVMHELDEFSDEPVLFIGDEIHEKDFDTELAVACTVLELPRHPKWRLVLASATLDDSVIQEAYAEYNNRPVPKVEVEGRPHELTIIEEPELTPEQAYEKYGHEHQKTQIFVAGKAEIKKTSDAVRKVKKGRLRITPLHSRLSKDKIRKATHAVLSENESQVIPSTNAGQSGITIPGLTLVISDGTTRRPELDLDGASGIYKQHCAKDEIIQQGGRAGRDVAGGVLVLTKPEDKLFDFVSLEDREPHAPAQIYNTNISRNVLQVASMGKDFFTINKALISKVDKRTIIEAYEVLFRLGALDEFNEITETGMAMSKFPLRPEFSRTLVAAMQEGVDTATLRHLVAITSAFEAGGLPYFEKDIPEKWRVDIKEDTTDDFIAQLDMFYATRELYFGDYVDEKSLEERNYDLINTYQAHHTYDKICRQLGLTIRDIPIDSPTSEQKKIIYDYMAAGMFDFAHKRLEPDDTHRTASYASVFDKDSHTQRSLSDRGTYEGKHKLVLGMPRGYEKTVKGKMERFNVVENVAPTSVRQLGRWVTHLVQRVPQEATVVAGRLKRTDGLYFGNVLVGREESRAKVAHTEETRQALREAAFAKPTQALEELITIKKELEWLVRRIPNHELEEYFPGGILSDEWLMQQVEDATDNNVDSIYLLDNNLRTKIVQERISIFTWIDQAGIEDIRARSPETVDFPGGATYGLYYTHGNVIINGFNLRDVDNLPDELRLADGREIRINYRIGKDTKAHSVAEIKAYADTL